MAQDSIRTLRESLSAPLGDFIAAVGQGVGEAQAALDEGSLEKTLEIYSNPDNADELARVLREMGYQPTFYTIPEVKAAAKMSLTFSQSSAGVNPNQIRRLRPKLYATPMNATTSNQYNMNIQGSSQIEFTIRPIPTEELSKIRRLPNFIQKSDSKIKRNWLEIKILADQFGLEVQVYKILDDVSTIIENLDSIDDTAEFQVQFPKADTIVRDGDIVRLEIVSVGS